MQDQRVRRVVIAGGGTAGWTAAAALASQLGPLLDITLVESEDIGTVGVGEATIPTMRGFHTLLGIDEQAFMAATQATFKLGISFENWALEGDRYIHSFGQIGKPTWMADFHHLWLKARAGGWGGELDAYCFESRAAQAGKFATSPSSAINYAYHLDAGLYGGFLREFSEVRGVTRREGRIAQVHRDGDSGDILALELADGSRVEGELFIDCTGFRGLLIEQALEAGYEDWSDWLATNSALAVQTASTGEIPPYTRAMAHDAGWQWRIPLRHRTGNGLVYCSDHLGDDAARDRLLSSLDGNPITDPRLIRYRTGRRKSVWSHNCVAVGLASGFVEPLESTSIHLIQIGITRLIQLFPFTGCKPALAARYNEQSRHELERVRDFIILHYALNRRDDAFWTRCRDMDLPGSLADRIALFRESARAFQGNDELFRVDSWVQVMLGQRLDPEGFHDMGGLLGEERLRQALGTLSANITTAVDRMPSHADFLAAHLPAG